ncbi:hypothetical protein HID58_033515 [Brassica napus]|uniref:Uncharacterized protein n=1 Tax=Brassica napus TaxID=3708 RepID=A0ABQ8BZF0_BRANA|nr:hypothetical protein HID58_033515 [Brassica napus]
MVFENVQYNPISIISKAEEEADIWFATNSPSGGVERRKTNVVQLVGGWQSPPRGLSKCSTGSSWDAMRKMSGKKTFLFPLQTQDDGDLFQLVLSTFSGITYSVLGCGQHANTTSFLNPHPPLQEWLCLSVISSRGMVLLYLRLSIAFIPLVDGVWRTSLTAVTMQLKQSLLK